MAVDPRQVQSIFLAVVEQADPAERRKLLALRCAGNAPLRSRVEDLLAAHERPEQLPPAAPQVDFTLDSPQQRPGVVVAGRYKLLEQIGEGGMGTVWVAEQTEPVRRRVALKLIKPGMDTKQVLSRFEAERQALALMDHPHIAKVYDGGMTDEGRPFFAMEYVKGMPITEYCDQVRLPIAERLKLFVSVCQAVQHAHQKGIVHRDLKPSNILVCLYDGQPVPKVIDFGLAKAMHQPLTERTVYTAHGLLVGTPLYMSPEQAEFNNLDIDTRSDIYSLGVILYELLTGTTPLDRQRFKDAAWQEIVRLIKEQEPSKPSTKVSGSGSLPTIAAQRSLEPAQLSRMVRGDLDWIVMKALEKERSRRYETANGLARDVERFLNDQPVEACPPSAAYRFQKFALRNRASLMAGGLVAGALLVGTAAATWQAVRATNAENRAIKLLDAETAARKDADQAREQAETQRLRAEAGEERAKVQQARAEQNYRMAQRAIDEHLTKVSENQLLAVAGMQPLRRELLQSALEFYEQLLAERGDDPEIQTELAAATLRVGGIYNELGELVQGRRILQRAIRLHEALLAGEPGNRDLQAGLARAHHRSGEYLRAVEIWRGLLAADPANPEYQRSLAMAYNSLAVNASDLNEQLERHQSALALQAELVGLDPGNLEDRNNLGATLNNIGVILSEQGQDEATLAMFLRAVEHSRVAYRGAPQNVTFGQFLATSCGNVASTLNDLGRRRQAIEYQEEQVRVLGRLARDNPAVGSLAQSLATSYLELLRMQRELQQFDEARRSLALAQDAARAMPKKTAADYFTSATLLALCADALGVEEELDADGRAARQKLCDDALHDLAQWVEEGYFREPANALQNEDLAVLRDRPDYQALLARMEQVQQAAAQAAQAGDAETKLKNQQQALAARRELAEREPASLRLKFDVAASRHGFALTLAELGRYAAAEEALHEVLAEYERLGRQQPDKLASHAGAARAEEGLARLSWRKRDYAGAARWADRAIERLRELRTRFPEESEPGALWRSTHVLVAEGALELGLLEKAAESYALAHDELAEQNAQQAYVHALLCLLAGDRDGYRQVRDSWFRRQRKSRDPYQQYQAGRVVIVGGEFGPEQEPADLIALCEAGWKQDSSLWDRAAFTGLACYRAGRYAEALEWFEQAYALNAEWVQGWYLLAMAHHQLGNGTQAAEWLALGELSRRNRLRSTAEGAASSLWDFLEGELLAREALALLGGSPAEGETWLHLVAGRGYRLLGERQKAEEHLAAAAAPDDAPIWTARAGIFAELGEFQRAESDLEAAARLAPRDARPWIALGRYRAERGEQAAADEAFQTAARQTSDELNLFLEDGWWIAGPYEQDFDAPGPPEQSADPALPVDLPGDRGSGQLVPGRWRRAPKASYGTVYVNESFPDTDRTSTYGLAYVYSPDERSCVMAAAGDDMIRVWVNGQPVHVNREPNWGWLGGKYFSIQLKPGRNTVLVKAYNVRGPHWFNVRLADSVYDKAQLAADCGLWQEALDLCERAQRREPPVPQLWLSYGIAGLQQRPEAFERVRKQWMPLLRWPERTGVSHDVLLLMTLNPHPEVDPAGLFKLAQRAYEIPADKWRLRPVIAAHLRAGQLEDALRICRECDPHDADSRGLYRQAMVHRQQDRADLARDCLDRAESRFREHVGHRLERSLYFTLNPAADFADKLVTRRETWNAVAGQEPPHEPLLEQLQQMALAELSGEGRASPLAAPGEPFDPGAERRGQAAVARGDWRTAAAEYVAACRDPNASSVLWMQAPVALLMAGDVAGYRRQCELMQERFRGSPGWEDSERLCKASALSTTGLDVSRLPVEQFTGPLAAGAAPQAFVQWGYGSWAIVAYRAGDWRQAIEAAEKAGLGRINEPLVQGLLITAMAKHQLGEPDEARRALELARAKCAELLSTNDDGSIDVPRHAGWWLDVAIVELLRREAEELLHPRDPPAETR